MKKFLGLLLGLLMVFGVVGSATAMTTTFDFEDGTNKWGPLSGLNGYMDTTFGKDVDVGDMIWYGKSMWPGGDDVWTKGYSSTFDFDTVADDSSSFKLTSIELDWYVYDETPGKDFALDVYDDATGNWRNNIFKVSNVGNKSSGHMDEIIFDTAWEITKIRIHDSCTWDVGMDNLILKDNRNPVPEPATMLLFGLGILGIAGVSRKKQK